MRSLAERNLCVQVNLTAELIMVVVVVHFDGESVPEVSFSAPYGIDDDHTCVITGHVSP